MKPLHVTLSLLVACFAARVLAQSSIQVLPPQAGRQPDHIMQDWLLEQADQRFAEWQTRYEQLETPGQIAAYQQELRAQFESSIGGLPERTPLNAQVTGTVHRDGYRVEKILYESRPGHYVTGLCFVPEPNAADAERFHKPYPGVLVVCGHSANGKGYEGYQTATALLAKNGIVGFIIDPICQGERLQHFGEDQNVLVSSSTQGHTLVGLGAILLGQNTARIEIWDAMRGVDYLQQRPDVAPDRIGCMGNSGGGTQTAYMMALDDRIQAASPACYVTTFERLLHTIGPQDAEQNIFGQIQWGMEHSDYLLMRAPIPILMCTATRDFFSIEGAWTSFRRGKRLYSRLGFPERISLVEVDEQHGWHQPLREAAVQWMVRWLAGRDEVVREPELKLLTPDEEQVTPRGQVLWLPGARSVNQQQHAEFLELQAERDAIWKDADSARAAVRKIAGIRRLADIPLPQVERAATLEVDGVTIESLILTNDDGLPLPALLYRSAHIDKSQADSKSAQRNAIVYVHDAGKQAGFEVDGDQRSALSYAKAGHTVLAIDPRGIGETAPSDAVWYHPRFGQDGKHVAIAYLLGKNYVGMRAEDLLVAARWLQGEINPSINAKIDLVCSGSPVATAGLHAAALEDELFAHIKLHQSLPSWEPVLESLTSESQFVNCIHGATRVYDLSDLIAILGDRVAILEPVDAMGNVGESKSISSQ